MTTAVVTAMVTGVVGSASAQPQHATAATPRPWANRALSADQRATLLEGRMTLAEKLTLVAGDGFCVDGGDGYVPGIPRLGVPALKLIGAGMGVTDICGRRVAGPTTELPAPIAMAATWDPAAAFNDGAVIGRETRDIGFDFSIGGDVNIARDPRNGRTFEAEGEDPLLAGTIVGAQLRGTQAQHIPATIKHFAENNEEQYRYGQSSNVAERTTREIELRAFEIGIERSDVGAVMCSYNRINGTPACQDRALLDGVLERDWHYKGFVMTDWVACASPHDAAGNPVPTCSTSAAAASGLDQQQPLPTFFSASALRAAIAGSRVRRSQLDLMVQRILRTIFASGLYDHPVVPHPIQVQADAATAQRVEERAAVLLRNVHATLPLRASATRSIAVIGALAAAPPPEAKFPSSAYVVPISPDTPLSAIRRRVPHTSVRFLDGSDVGAAAALARRSRAVIVFAGDTEQEGVNRASLALDGRADALIRAVAAANHHTVVVLETGGPVTMPWINRVGAVLEAWYPGERGGHAIARLLFGDVNPSGRLPITFPVREADLPTARSRRQWPGTPENIDYTEGLLVGYRWYDAKHIRPLFPFGFGLSYGARFSYADLEITPTAGTVPDPVREDQSIATVSFTIANDGTRKATDVAQVHTGFPALAGEPPRRLVAWRRVQVAPGRRVAVTVALDASSFDYWSTAAHSWSIAAGEYPIWVGSSSRNLLLAGTLSLGRGSAATAAAPSSARF